MITNLLYFCQICLSSRDSFSILSFYKKLAFLITFHTRHSWNQLPMLNSQWVLQNLLSISILSHSPLSYKLLLVFCFSVQTLAMYNYFKEAQRIAKEIKSSFSNDPDKLAELKRLEQIAEHNGVALNLICRVGALDPSLKVTFEFSHHPFFATAVVKRSWTIP